MADDAVVVGRERLLRTLQDEFERASDGRGRLVTVSGEPGIGKTTLVEAFATRVQRRGAAVLWGSAWESGGTSAYWPWLQVLRAARHGFGVDVPDLAPAAVSPGPPRWTPWPRSRDGSPSSSWSESASNGWRRRDRS